MQINLWESLAGQGHPPLEVISWIAGLLGAIAVSTAGATWVVKRWHETRTEPYGLRVLLDVAVGDPGHTVFVLNQRGAPIRVECWGVMPWRQVPRLAVSRIIDSDRVDSRAIGQVADVVFGIPAEIIEPGDFRFLRTVLGPESVLTPEEQDRFQSPDATEAELAGLLEAMSAFEELAPRYLGWTSNVRLVPFVQVPGVGYIFGLPARGSISEGGGYRGYPCQSCGHDFSRHHMDAKRGWRRLDGVAAQCQLCSCGRFKGQAAPRPPRDSLR